MAGNNGKSGVGGMLQTFPSHAFIANKLATVPVVLEDVTLGLVIAPE